MNNINEITEEIIRAAKPALEEVRFVKAFGSSPGVKPLDGFLAVVSLEGVRRRKCFIGGMSPNGLKGDLYSADMRVTLHAPYSEGGEALSLKALKLSDELRYADRNGYICDVSISGITYDSRSLSVCREVRLTISYYMCEVEDV